MQPKLKLHLPSYKCKNIACFHPSDSLSCVICFVDSLLVPRVQTCHIPVITAWIYLNDSAFCTVSHLPRTLWRKSFVLMVDCEEQKQVRAQNGWLLVTPPVPDDAFCFFRKFDFWINLSFNCVAPLKKQQIGVLKKAAKSGNGRLIKRSKGIN